MAMDLREDFLISVKEDSPTAFLRFIERHVSTILSGIMDNVIWRMYSFQVC